MQKHTRLSALAMFLALGFVSMTQAIADGNVFRQEFGQTQSRGNATISSPQGGGLIVSNIGSSGLDGVSIDVGRVRNTLGPIQWMTPEGLPGRGIAVVVTGQDSTGMAVQFMSSSVENNLGEHDVHFNPMATGGTHVTLTVFDNGSPVYQGIHQLDVNPIFTTDSPPIGVTAGLGEAPYRAYPIEDLTWPYAPGTAIDIPGQGRTHGETVTVAINSRLHVRTTLTDMEILGVEPAGSIGELVITELPSGIFGHTSGRLGQAQIIGSGDFFSDGLDRLTVSNIGSSGLDGVSIDLGEGDDVLGFALDPLPPSVASKKLFVGGLSWAIDDGTGSGFPQVNCFGHNEFFDLYQDLSVGGPPAVIEFYLFDELMTTAADPAATVHLMKLQEDPMQCRISPPGASPTSDLVMEFHWEGPLEYIDDFGLSRLVDRVRMIYPDDPTLPFYPLDEYFLRMADIPGNELVITGYPNRIAPGPSNEWSSASGLGSSNLSLDSDGHLVVDNLGSSGCDGVSIDLPPDPVQTMQWTTRGLKPPHAGHITVMKAMGQAPGGGGGGIPIGSFSAEGDDTQALFSADLSESGATDLIFNFYDQGALVGSAICPNGVDCFSSSEMPVGFSSSLSHPDGRPRLFVELPENTFVSILGGAPSQGMTDKMNKAELVEAMASNLVASPLSNVSQLVWNGSEGGTMHITAAGSGTFSGVSTLPIPSIGMKLHPASPNPFNPSTTIAYDLKREGDISLQVYDLRGQVVRNLFDGFQVAGSFQTVWNGRDAQGRSLPSGTYLVQLRNGARTDNQKIVLVK